jgi:hypothetical protein
VRLPDDTVRTMPSYLAVVYVDVSRCIDADQRSRVSPTWASR